MRMFAWRCTVVSQALAGVVRPRGFPGTQAYRALVPQPACQAANSSASSSALQVAAAPPPPAVAPQLQCWSHMGAYDDLGVYGDHIRHAPSTCRRAIHPRNPYMHVRPRQFHTSF